MEKHDEVLIALRQIIRAIDMHSKRLIKESRQLVLRIRSETDKRKVHATLTDAGRALLAQAPTPLQESFIQRFQALENWEQGLLLSSLQRISAMMNAGGIVAAPVLSVSPLTEARA